MDSQQTERDEKLLGRDNTDDLSTGSLRGVSDDADAENLDDEDEAEEESAADDELEEDL